MANHLPIMINLRMDDTPWHDDPDSAEALYTWLGITAVAWGRLEGHVVAVLMSIRALPGTFILPGTFPVSCKRKAKTWRTAFQTMPILQPYAALALQNMVDIMFYVQKRHYLSHAMWTGFSSAGGMLSARSFTARPHDQDASDNTFLVENLISVADLQAITGEANKLNSELGTVSRAIASLRPPPSHFRSI